MQNVKRKHHYLPKYYLEGFCDDDGRIWTYRKNDPLNPYPNKPDSTAVINEFYSLSGNNSKSGLEDWFANEIETPVADMFKELREKKFSSPEKKKLLALFFGTLMARTPAYIENINELQKKQVSVMAKVSASDKEQFYAAYKKLFDIEPAIIEEERKAILENNISFSLDKNTLLKDMIFNGVVFADILFKMNWSLIETNEEYPFITSDNPINIFNQNVPVNGFFKPGLGSPDTRVFLPISKELSLLLVNDQSFLEGNIYSVAEKRYSNNQNKAKIKKLVKCLNKTVYIRSYHYVFANSGSDKLKKCFYNLFRGAQLIEANMDKNKKSQDSVEKK